MTSRVVVIGAGVGGLTAAIRLARAGHAVEVHERSATPGGKLAVYERDGFRFDTGPSLLTLPQVFEDLQLPLVKLDPVVRHFFPDGTVLDSSATHEVFLDRIRETLGAGAAADWHRFWRRAERIWHASWRSVLRRPVSPSSLAALSWRLPDLATIAPGRTLRGLGYRYLRDPRLRMLLERYATYTGADPRRAPAALAAVPYAELHFGGWYLRGGLSALGTALADRCAELGVRIVLNSEVTGIETTDSRVGDFRGANARGGDFRGANARGGDFRDDDAWIGDFRGGDARGGNARVRDFQGGDARAGDARDSDLWGSDAQGDDLRGGIARGSDLRSGNTRGSGLRGGNARDGSLPGGNARGSDLRGDDFWGGDLRDDDARGGRARDGGARGRGARGGERVSGVRVAGGGVIPADVVVSDVDALTLYRDLLPSPARLARLADRSLAGFVLLLGVRGETPSLAHHNVFFPTWYDAEFDAVFGSASRRARPASDPTIFVTRATDPTVHPPGDEAWFVLVNAPPHGTGWHTTDWRRPGLADAYARHILDVLARRGLDVRDRLAFLETRTPADLAGATAAPGGAIYGTAGSLLRPANRGPVDGLFLVGGSVHPGGGLPMVTLSAQIVADQIGAAEDPAASPDRTDRADRTDRTDRTDN